MHYRAMNFKLSLIEAHIVIATNMTEYMNSVLQGRKLK